MTIRARWWTGDAREAAQRLKHDQDSGLRSRPWISMVGLSDAAYTRMKNGAAWRIGTDEDVAWVKNGTVSGLAITSAIPPVFADYATLRLPGKLGVPRDHADEGRQDRALLALLQTHTSGQSWWLGYLDTGASDIVFWDAPKVELYTGWQYVLIQAGPAQAASWRPADGSSNWKSTELPDLMFPADRSWLISTLWDDDWTCIGGPKTLIADLLLEATLRYASVPPRIATSTSPGPPAPG